MAMTLAPNAAKLRAAGVRRVVLAAADDDDARASLANAARTLEDGGIAARFMSLGRVGHHFARDMDERMVEAIACVRGVRAR